MALYKALVSIVYAETPIPSGSTVSTDVSTVSVSLLQKDTMAEVSSVRIGNNTPSYTFTDVPEGDYTVSVSQLDDSGNTIGTPATVDFSIVAAPVAATFFAPAGVSVEVSAQ
jgi:hypothetical protein